MLKTLIKKDFYEYKNNLRKTIGTIFFSILIPIALFNYMGVSSAYFVNLDLFIELIVILFSMIVYCETTLFQVYRDVRDGVYEKYFINHQIRKVDILISKCILNFILTLFIIALMYFSNQVVQHFAIQHFQFSLNTHLFIIAFFASLIGTCLAFIASLMIKDEKNATIYGISIFALFLGYYKILEVMEITSFLLEVLGLLLISVVMIFIVVYLLNKNRFISQ